MAENVAFGISREISKDDRKLRRAIQRIYAGFEAKIPDFQGGKCKNYLLVTLTTPEGCGVDMHRAWRKLIMRLRRRGMAREYYCVREWNKKGTCQHIHAIFRANYIEAGAIRQQWTASVGQSEGMLWCHIDRLYGGYRGIARYLTKYLVKGIEDYKELRETASRPRARGYWYAYDWIFRGWRSFCSIAYRIGKQVPIQDYYGLGGKCKLKMVLCLLRHWPEIMATDITKNLVKRLRVCGIGISAREGLVLCV